MEERQTLAPGTVVYSADGQKLGAIQSSEDASFRLQDGDLPSDIQIPLSAIVMSRDGEVHLSVTRADALEQRWTQNPAARMAPDHAAEPGSDYTAVQGEDSLAEDPMPTPGAGSMSGPVARPAVAGGGLERPSGETGPVQDGGA